MMDELFDHLPDTAFFVKDCEGRYLLANQSLAERVGLRRKQELIGRHVRDVFPPELARRYAAQDQQVLRTGRPIVDKLELHWYQRQQTGWCLTTKLPLRDAAGRIIGLFGISHDLNVPGDAERIPPGLSAALDYLEAHYAEPISPAELARLAGLSPVRFARLIKRIYRITPSQLINKTRLGNASQILIETRQPVIEVAHACGFYDQSAFARAFKAATGLTPTQFRQRQGR